MVTGSSVWRAARYLHLIRIKYRDYCLKRSTLLAARSLGAIEGAQYGAGSPGAPTMISADKREKAAPVGMIQPVFQASKLLVRARQGMWFDLTDRMEARCNLLHGATMLTIVRSPRNPVEKRVRAIGQCR
jgi:hypothetical protein